MNDSLTDPNHDKSAENAMNPLASAAATLIKFEGCVQEPHKFRSTIEKALKNQTLKIEADDFSGMEMILVCQAQMLHRIFSQSVEKYVASGVPEKDHFYSALALKAQNYCRMTVDALAQLKNRKNVERTIKLEETMYKSSNELLRKHPYETMDPRRTQASVTIDPWLAAMDAELWR